MLGNHLRKVFRLHRHAKAWLQYCRFEGMAAKGDGRSLHLNCVRA